MIGDSLRSTQLAVRNISAHVGLPDVIQSVAIAETTPSDSNLERETTAQGSHPEDLNTNQYHGDLVSKGILSEEKCRELFDLYVPINITMNGQKNTITNAHNPVSKINLAKRLHFSTTQLLHLKAFASRLCFLQRYAQLVLGLLHPSYMIDA